MKYINIPKISDTTIDLTEKLKEGANLIAVVV